jgi:uncharacterized membrane-anchored protein YitT (DUF2179 family)
MELIIKRKPIIDFILIIIGVTFLAAAINIFFEPMGMVTGGVTGLAIVIKEITGIPLYVSNFTINIPLFVVAVILKGKDFGARSFFATIFLSFALFYTQWFPAVTEDILLGSIFGGILAGVGLGLVFMTFSTTGGTDLAASIVQHFIKHISLAQLMLVLDAIIITLGLFMFGAEKTMYAIISVFISAKVIDTILEGIHFSKATFIISDKYEDISSELMERLDRGVTGLDGNGMYTKMSKKVLLCVVSKRQIVKLKEIVKEIDKDAFVIVADVREVLGEGFIEY